MRSRKIRFSKIELNDLFKSWLVISLVFSAFIFRTNIPFVYAFLISAITVGTGFLLHEMGHKIVAQRYGCFAEFRAFDQMLVFAMFLGFLCFIGAFCFIFVAPGAVMISGFVSGTRNGKISTAGPLTNIILAILFLAVALSIKNELVILITSYGFRINSWIALFNMIPLGNFDGRKILDWNRGVWAALAITAFIFSFLIG